MADKPTIKEFVRELRDKFKDIPDTMSDIEVFKSVAEVDPSVFQTVNTAESTAGHRKPPPDPGFFSGMVAPIREAGQALINPKTYKGMAQTLAKQAFASSLNPGENREMVKKDLARQSEAAGGAGALVDLPNISKAEQQGHWGEATGRATTQGLLLAPMAMGLIPRGPSGAQSLEAISNTGRGLKVADANLEAAVAETRAQSSWLDAEIDGIRGHLSKEWVDVKTLRSSIKSAVDQISKIDKSPGMQVRDVSAAKDVIGRLADRLAKGKGMMSWPDAQEFAKEIRNAAVKTRGASQLRDSLWKTSESMEDILEVPAKRAGLGDAYTTWRQNSRILHNLQRAHAKITGGTTASQLRASATKGPSFGIPRTGIRIGGRAVQRAGKAQFKQWDAALEEFNKRINMPKGYKGQPAAPPPVAGAGAQPPNTPPGGPAPGGAQPPPPAGPAGPGAPPTPPGGGGQPPPAAPPAGGAAPPAQPPPAGVLNAHANSIFGDDFNNLTMEQQQQVFKSAQKTVGPITQGPAQSPAPGGPAGQPVPPAGATAAEAPVGFTDDLLKNEGVQAMLKEQLAKEPGILQEQTPRGDMFRALAKKLADPNEAAQVLFGKGLDKLDGLQRAHFDRIRQLFGHGDKPPSGGGGGATPMPKPVGGGSTPQVPSGPGGGGGGGVSETQQAINDLLKSMSEPTGWGNVVTDDRFDTRLNVPRSKPADVLPWKTKPKP